MELMANVVYTESPNFCTRLELHVFSWLGCRPSFVIRQVAARLFVGDLLQIAKLGRRDVCLDSALQVHAAYELPS